MDKADDLSVGEEEISAWRKWYASLSPEAKAAFRERQNANRKTRIAAMTPDEREDFRRGNRARGKAWYAAMSPVERAYRNARNSAQKKSRFASMSHDAKVALRDRQNAQHRDRRALMSPEKHMEYHEKVFERNAKKQWKKNRALAEAAGMPYMTLEKFLESKRPAWREAYLKHQTKKKSEEERKRVFADKRERETKLGDIEREQMLLHSEDARPNIGDLKRYIASQE